MLTVVHSKERVIETPQQKREKQKISDWAKQLTEQWRKRDEEKAQKMITEAKKKIAAERELKRKSL